MIEKVEIGRYNDTNCTGFKSAIAYIDALDTEERFCQSCTESKSCYKVLHINTWEDYSCGYPIIKRDEYESYFCEKCIKQRMSEVSNGTDK